MVWSSYSITRTLRLAFTGLLLLGAAAGGMAAETSSKVVVTPDSISFDPKTCIEGSAHVDWSFGYFSVKLRGRENGNCTFDYVENLELGETHYRVAVPLDSGPVTVRVGEIREGNTVSRGVITSFPRDRATMIRTGVPGLAWDVRVGNTGEFLSYRNLERRGETPLRRGDRVKFRFRLYADPDYTALLPGAAPDPTLELVVGSKAAWTWLDAASEEMGVGDRRHVRVPAKVAEGARKWLPAGSTVKELYLELSLVSLDRAK